MLTTWLHTVVFTSTQLFLEVAITSAMLFLKIDRENKFCITLGDFNLDLLKLDSHSDTENVLNTLGSFSFQPHSQTLLDNIFFNSLEHFTLSANIVYDLSDHLPNFLIIKKFTSLPNNVKIYKRDYSIISNSRYPVS